MKRKKVIVSVLLLALVTALVIYLVNSHGAEKPADDAGDSPIDTVTTTTLKQGSLAKTIVACGSVTAQPGEIAVWSVPYECRVRRAAVTAGQPIDKGSLLIDIEPSPTAMLALAEARSNLEAASKSLSQSQQSFSMKLATNADLLAAEQAVQLAQLRLDNLTQQGAGSDTRSIRADSPGLVARIDVQQGQIVPAGSPLVETIAGDQLEVRLGVESADLDQLSIGQKVQLFVGSGGGPVAGKIRLITQRINPDTRLVDVFVTPVSSGNLLLDSFVRGEITSQTESVLIAPRDAVLPDEDGLTLFTVKDGKAVRHIVAIQTQNDRENAVISGDLHPGDTIVTQGNLELEDGMAVTTEEPR